jgi:hypothetical protein
MEERTRDDGFEVTFVVSTSREQAWSWLTEARPAFEGLAEPRDGQWWIPAVEAPGDELEVEAGKKLRVRKAVQPCKGTEIVIVMEDEQSGTRITFVQTGFGAGFDAQRPWLTAGWHAIRHDLVVFFSRGASIGRHASLWSSIGCDVREEDEGLVVASIVPGGFADQSGLQAGDLILQLAGAPIVNIRELSVLVRGPLRTGAETKVRYLRGAEVLSGSGTI